jgi:hypothetical protein
MFPEHLYSLAMKVHVVLFFGILCYLYVCMAVHIVCVSSPLLETFHRTFDLFARATILNHTFNIFICKSLYNRLNDWSLVA